MVGEIWSILQRLPPYRCRRLVLRLHGGRAVLEFISSPLRSSMFAFRVSGLLAKTGPFKMAFVRVLAINTGAELRTAIKKKASLSNL